LSGPLTVQHGTSADLVLDDTGGTYEFKIHSQDNNLQFRSEDVQKGRYRGSDNTWEFVQHTVQPTGLIANAYAIYRVEADDQLWVTWKDTAPSTHHAMVARSKRTVVSLTPGEATLTTNATYQPIGANTDVASVRFSNAGTGTAVWSFTRPPDWDYGKIQVTVYWTNYDNNVSGNHYWPQRMLGCAVGEHLGPTQTCNTLISGAQTTAGLNNSSLIGSTVIPMGSASDLTGEDFLFYRIQRQGAHGSDTSGQNWEVIHITVEMITT
jgi:hypothetical protein